MYASYDTAFNDNYVDKKEKECTQKKNDKIKYLQEKYNNSQYVQIGTYSFLWRSKMPDKLIYDKINNKYFIIDYGKIIKDNVTIKEINDNNKNINNYNMFYSLFEKEKYIPVLFINNKYVSIDEL